MLTLILTSMLITAEPNQPTEVYGAAASSDGGQNTITVQQPENMQNPFGYIAPETTTQQPSQPATQPSEHTASTAPKTSRQPSYSQTSLPLSTPKI